MREDKLDRYFAAVLLDIAGRMDTVALSKDLTFVYLVDSTDYQIRSNEFFDQLFDWGLRYLLEMNMARVDNDEFGPTVVELITKVDELDLDEFDNAIGKMSKYGSKWIEEAIANIQAGNHNEGAGSLSEISEANRDTEWKPLKIERSPEELELDLEVLDAELSKIEGDNGYADTEPEERNAILKPARSVLQAIKDGEVPTKDVVFSTLMAPFKYLSKKFADASIGIAAKKFFEIVTQWF